MKRRLMAMFLALTMLVSMAPGVFAADTGFSDVAPDAWYAEAVKWAVDNDITGGIGDGKFGPDQTCTRGQVVTFLWAAAGKPVMENADNPFADVSASDWYYNAVMWAVSNNITGGTSATTFSPEAPCTRAQVVTFLYAAEGKPAVENAKNDFVDVAANDWFCAPVMWAVANDITGGIGNGCFGPDNPCTRGQIALFLYKASLVGGEEPEVTPEPTPAVVTSAEEAIALFAASEADYGYDNALSELTEKHTTTIEGDSYYRLQQNYKGIPVYGRTVVCAADENGEVMAVTGNPADVVGDIDLTPSVTVEQVQSAVAAYFEDGENDDADQIVEMLSDADLCIYNLDETSDARLAYCIGVGGCELLIDADTAEILLEVQTMFEGSAIGYMASDMAKQNGFNIEQTAGAGYVMHDMLRSISVYTFNGKASGWKDDFKPKRAKLLESSNNIFGDTDEEVKLEQEKGARLLNNITFVYDYFRSNGFVSVEETRLYYNDGYENGNNARGGTAGEGFNVVSMGTVTGVDCFDVVAHEYTHVVSRDTVEWIGGGENGAVNEALSDIFGEILEYKRYGKPVDWLHDGGVRNLIDPSLSTEDNRAHPSQYAGENWYIGSEDNGGVHFNSTVISHAAYLMSTDGGGLLTMDELGNLWYRAMLLMPSDCNFNDCRNVVELAGITIGLTDDKLECISAAFREVWISGRPIKEEVHTVLFLHRHGTLSVYGANGDLYDNYKVELTLEPTFDKLLTTSMATKLNRVMMVTAAEAKRLNLSWGFYRCKITDLADPNRTKEFYVQASYDDTLSNLDVYTDFGQAKVTGNVQKIELVNDVQFVLSIEGASVRIYERDSGDFVDSATVEDINKGFAFTLPYGDYTLEATAEGFVTGKKDFTVGTEDIELNIVLEPAEADNTEAYAAYVPVVEKAIQDTKNAEYEFMVDDSQWTQGYLVDMDDDGIDELLMSYYYQSYSDDYSYTVYSVYDYEGGDLKTVVNRGRIVEQTPPGFVGYAAVVIFDGKPVILIVDEEGYGSGPASKHLYTYRFYEYPSLKPVYSLAHWQREEDMDEGLEELNTFYVNGEETTKEEFLAGLARCDELKFGKSHWSDFYTGDPMSLNETLKAVRGPVIYKGTVYADKFTEGVTTQVPVPYAEIKLWYWDEETETEIGETVYADENGCFEVDLTDVYGYDAKISADGYISKTTSFSAYDENLEASIRLVPDTYETVAQAFMDKHGYNYMDKNQRNRSRGMLCDLNGDGQDELILRAMLKDGKVYENTYEVWTVINGETQMLLDYTPEKLGEYFYLAEYNGNRYLAIEEVSPGTMAVAIEWHFYDVDNNPYETGLHLDYWEMHDESEGTYAIDGRDVTKVEFDAVKDQITTVYDLFNEWEDGYDGYPLYELVYQEVG